MRALVLLLLLAGCATTSKPDPAPPPTAIQVSTSCKALDEVPKYPEVSPDDTLKVLGQACKAKDDRSCARAVYLLGLDRERLKEWAAIAAIAIERCNK